MHYVTSVLRASCVVEVLSQRGFPRFERRFFGSVVFLHVLVGCVIALVPLTLRGELVDAARLVLPDHVSRDEPCQVPGDHVVVELRVLHDLYLLRWPLCLRYDGREDMESGSFFHHLCHSSLHAVSCVSSLFILRFLLWLAEIRQCILHLEEERAS